MPCCDDRSILPFHIHREDFSDYRIAIPNATSMHLLFDKECTHEMCVELGIPAAPGARLQSDDSAQDLISRFGLPLVIRRRRSYWADRLDAWGKVFIVESDTELRKVLDTIQEPWRYLVEGYFEGEGVGFSVLAENGTILQSFQHRRLREAGADRARTASANRSIRASKPRVRRSQLTPASPAFACSSSVRRGCRDADPFMLHLYAALAREASAHREAHLSCVAAKKASSVRWAIRATSKRPVSLASSPGPAGSE